MSLYLNEFFFVTWSNNAVMHEPSPSQSPAYMSFFYFNLTLTSQRATINPAILIGNHSVYLAPVI